MTPRVHLDQDLFGDLDPSTPGRIQDSSLLVEADDEPAAAAVLRRAALRLGAVTADGVELRSEADWDALTAEEDPAPPPSWVSPVYRSDLGLAMVMDCAGEVPEAQALTFKRILREEFEADGVSARIRSWPADFASGEAYFPDEAV